MSKIHGILDLSKVKDKLSLYTEGHNDNISTVFQDMWSEGGDYVFPPAATIMTLSSSDANDTAAGTGVRTVRVHGLDSNWNRQTEIVTMDGLTGVNTINEYIRTNDLEAEDVGSSEFNEGSVYLGVGTITAGKPATVYNVIEPEKGESSQAIVSIPANYHSFISSYTISSDSQKASEMNIVVREFGESFKIFTPLHFFQGAFQRRYGAPVHLTNPKADIRLCAKVGTGAAEMTGDYELILSEA